MEKSSSRLLLIAGVAFAVWVAVFAGGVVFVMSGFANARAQYSSLRLQISQFEEKSTQYEKSLASYQGVSASAGSISKSFIGDDAILNLLVQLENEAKSTNNLYSVAVARDIPQTTKGSATASSKAAAPILPGTVLTISLTGKFANIFQFVRDVERLPYFIQVQRLTIRHAVISQSALPIVTAAATPQLQALFVIKVFSPAS